MHKRVGVFQTTIGSLWNRNIFKTAKTKSADYVWREQKHTVTRE